MRASFISSEVLTGLRRNITMTIAMILTTAISLGLFGGGLLVVQMAGKTQQIFLDRVEVQIFLTDDISANDPQCAEDTCRTLRTDLEQTPAVVSVQYLNRDDAVRDATERVFRDQPELAELVSADSFPASFKSDSATPSASASSTTTSALVRECRVCSTSAILSNDCSVSSTGCAMPHSPSRSCRQSLRYCSLPTWCR